MPMNMKEHILEALREQFDRWRKLLASLGEEEFTTPRFDFDWSIKDVIAHLWAWHQISIARMEADVQDRAPELPQCIVGSIENWEEDTNRVNALTFETQHEKPWSEIYGNWKSGFLRFLQLAEKIPERDLLDGDRYPWLHGYSLAAILISYYDHYQEHFEKLGNWLQLLGN